MKNCKDKNQKMKNQKNLRVDRMTLGYGNKNLRVPRINIPKMNTRNGLVFGGVLFSFNSC